MVKDTAKKPKDMEHLHLTSFLSASAPYSSLLPPKRSPIPTLSSEASNTQLLIRITNAALNHVDLLYARGQHQNNRKLVVPPFTLGSEFSGTVVAAGASVSYRYKQGDRVYGAALGAFSTHIIVEASSVRKVPQNWALRDTAGLPATLPVAYGALVQSAKIKKGETVLILAATGGIGVMLVQVARALGCRVIVTVSSEEKKRVLVKELAMDPKDVVLYGVDAWEAKVRALTGDEDDGVDVVIDLVGLVESSIRCCKYGGRVIIAGFAGRGGKMEKLSVNRILLKGVSLIGYRFGENNRRAYSDRKDPNTISEEEKIWTAVEDLMARGAVKPVTYHEQFTGLESVPKAMEAMAARKVYGKAIIDVAPEAEVICTRAKL